jgi:hypothetical protein
MIVVRWYLLGDSTRAVSSRSVRLLGEARVTLNVAPVRPRNGHALILTGEVVGARRGTRIVTRVRAGPYGRTFLALAVDQHGRYRGRRTLTDSAGVVYCLRAVALSQPNFAYAAGHSRVVCRRVRR